VHVAVFLLVIVSLVCASSGLSKAVQADEADELPFMLPDEATYEEWMRQYDSAPLTTDTLLEARSAARAPSGSFSLLADVPYIPSERSQGSCGNCWAWAGTGCLELALGQDTGIEERLSVQYLNSCEQSVIGKACCSGGWLSDVAAFYSSTGMCVPWSNPGAAWQGSQTCSVGCASIQTEPHYDISSIEMLTIPTHTGEPGVHGDDDAIANIKAALQSGHGVWFAFFTSSSVTWNEFAAFWLTEGEDAVCDLDALCSGPTRGPAHAVLCVGYEESRDEDYWLMLNSWGTAGGGRPNGTFRVEMDMDYDTRCVGYSFYWQTLDVQFEPPPPPTVETGNVSDVEETTARLHGTLVDGLGTECDCRFEYAEVGRPGATATEWQTGLTTGESFDADLQDLAPGTSYAFCAQAEAPGSIASGEEAFFVTKPLPPGHFSATATGETSARIRWTSATGAERTIVRGKKDSVPTDSEDGYAVYSGTGTSCDDSGLDPASTYWYAAWSVIDDATPGPLMSDDSASDDAHTIGNGVWMEGDVNLDGHCDIIDAMFIAQYTVGLRTLEETQLLCADTTDDGKVNIVDAMQIAQFTVDPDTSVGVLFKLIWESPSDEALLDPLDA
jgi:hypothetical protein